MTTARCRAGDLAIIVRDEPGCEANLGRFVKVHAPGVLTEEQGTTWLIVPVGDAPHRLVDVNDQLVERTIYLEDCIEHPDEWMVPIRPDRLLELEAKALLRLQQQIDEILVEVGVIDAAVNAKCSSPTRDAEAPCMKPSASSTNLDRLPTLSS